MNYTSGDPAKAHLTRGVTVDFAGLVQRKMKMRPLDQSGTGFACGQRVLSVPVLH